ncbi:nuclear transport factor 2 family protein [Mycobacterium sp. WMMD1722]|uniref:nuclear transport factor 2 family protein n=1 Tax=Mycobacterium sp. WMMD1722 TaxID=3404117 RepID=UPI003BF5F7E6
MADSVVTLMHDNLLAVFNEREQGKRREAARRTYAPDVRWTDAEGVTTGHDALEAKCVALQSGLGDLQFESVGPVHQLPGFAHLAWQLVDPADGQIQMTGFDAAVIKDSLITELWTVLIPPTSGEDAAEHVGRQAP